MIRPPGFAGAAFGLAADGDARRDDVARRFFSRALSIADDWAWVDQVHGAAVARAEVPGAAGAADALFTTVPGLPVTVATADCVPVVLEGDGVAAVVHAGWRGAAAGVVTAALRALEENGTPAVRAAVGPAIGSCCYEVGGDVADRFPGHVAETSWGTPSVDLPGVLGAQLTGLDVWQAALCTLHNEEFHSYRRDATHQRQVAVAWVPV
jgi:YfiH family protein